MYLSLYVVSDLTIDLGVVTFSQRHVKKTKEIKGSAIYTFCFRSKRVPSTSFAVLKNDMIGQYVWKDFGTWVHLLHLSRYTILEIRNAIILGNQTT